MKKILDNISKYQIFKTTYQSGSNQADNDHKNFEKYGRSNLALINVFF